MNVDSWLLLLINMNATFTLNRSLHMPTMYIDTYFNTNQCPCRQWTVWSGWNARSKVIKFVNVLHTGCDSLFETQKSPILNIFFSPFSNIGKQFGVARWYIFNPKIPIWVNLGVSCNGRCWYSHLGLFYGHSVNEMVVWSIFPRFAMLYLEKSGNPCKHDSIVW
jgi:hypothetical protein